MTGVDVLALLIAAAAGWLIGYWVGRAQGHLDSILDIEERLDDILDRDDDGRWRG